MPPRTGELWRLAVKNLPKAAAAIGAVSVYLKDHPGVSAWFREQFDLVRERLVAAQKRSGDAAKVRAMLDVVRDVSREWAAHEGDRSTADAAAWLRHADDIELGIRLAEKQPRPERRKTLLRLRAETDALLADLLRTMASARALPATGPAEETGPAEGGSPAA